jgi:two-component system, NtrC family, sensor histidine kinase HydH
VGTIPVKVQGLTEKRPELLADDYTAAKLREIEAQARAALEVARETVTYLRPVRLQPTSVAACYQAVRARLHVPPSVTLAAAGLESLPPVLAGDEPLRLVLFNLIENALDALGEAPGNIQVTGRLADDRLEPDRTWAEITVADSGPGVLAENRERIFEPDFSTKHSLKKLGFGLWWVKTWVQRCGGSIVLAGPAPVGGEAREAGAPADHGAAFVIRLPLASGDTP